MVALWKWKCGEGDKYKTLSEHLIINSHHILCLISIDRGVLCLENLTWRSSFLWSNSKTWRLLTLHGFYMEMKKNIWIIYCATARGWYGGWSFIQYVLGVTFLGIWKRYGEVGRETGVSQGRMYCGDSYYAWSCGLLWKGSFVEGVFHFIFAYVRNSACVWSERAQIFRSENPVYLE